MFKAIIFLILSVILSAGAVETNWPSGGQFLMVDQHGKIVPEGYAAGLTEIAQVEAQAAAVEQAAALVTASTAASSNVVNEVVAALTGTFGFAYITGFTTSFSGAVEVSTNVSSHIQVLELGQAGVMTTNSVQYTGHYIWHSYSEDMNTVPAIKYKRELDGTNAWQFVTYQSTSEHNNTVVNGVLFETIYRSTVWLPSIYNSAFFMVFCEIQGGGQAGGVLDVYEGLSIGGKVGFTGSVACDGYIEEYKSGLLMSVTPVEVE